MAKHPHRILLVEKRTWRCTLPGCSFFVHLGLTHVLLSKSAFCWDCNETFTVDQYALDHAKDGDGRVTCFSCRSGMGDFDIDADLEAKRIARGFLPARADRTPEEKPKQTKVKEPEKEDKPEVINPSEDTDTPEET